MFVARSQQFAPVVPGRIAGHEVWHWMSIVHDGTQMPASWPASGGPVSGRIGAPSPERGPPSAPGGSRMPESKSSPASPPAAQPATSSIDAHDANSTTLASFMVVRRHYASAPGPHKARPPTRA